MIEQEPKWPKIVAYIQDELARLHNSLEVIQPEATTNQLRGEIRALRRMLELGKPLVPTPPEKMIQPVSDPFI